MVKRQTRNDKIKGGTLGDIDSQLLALFGAIATTLITVIGVLWRAYHKANDDKFKLLQDYNKELRDVQKETTSALNNSAMAMNGLRDVITK